MAMKSVHYVISKRSGLYRKLWLLDDTVIAQSSMQRSMSAAKVQPTPKKVLAMQKRLVKAMKALGVQ